MKIISFAATTGALLDGCKTVTRRQWADRHAAMFHKGDIVQAYDKSPRNGGKKVAEIELTDDPVREPLYLMPDTDYLAEGFDWLYHHPEKIPKEIWGRPCSRERLSTQGFFQMQTWRDEVWVIRFRLLETVQNAS